MGFSGSLENNTLNGESDSLSHDRLFCNPMDCSPPDSSVRGIS